MPVVSSSKTVRKIVTCRDAKRAEALRRAVAGTKRPPIGIVVADRVVVDLTASVPGLRPAEWPGVWCTPHLDEGGLVVLDTSLLVDIRGLEFWAWLGGAPTPEEGARRMRLLLDSPALSNLTIHRLHEAIMSEQIPTTSAEQETTYQRVTRLARNEGRDEGRDEGLDEGRKAGRDEGRAHLLQLLERYAPERISEFQHVHDLDALRIALDEAIQARLSGARKG